MEIEAGVLKYSSPYFPSLGVRRASKHAVFPDEIGALFQPIAAIDVGAGAGGRREMFLLWMMRMATQNDIGFTFRQHGFSIVT